MMVAEAAMPATVLEFQRRPSAPPTEGERRRLVSPISVEQCFVLDRPSRRTPRQIAHRWAMLAHLLRHRTRPPHTVR
jgi:hypothetical protein